MIGLAMMLAAATDQPGPKFFKTGNEVLTLCSSSDFPDKIGCMEYIGGVNDGFATMAIIAKPLYCTSTNVTLGQVRDIVVKYLQENPEHRDWSGGTLSAMALAKAFPCPQS